MRFDNDQFEKNVKTSVKSIENLKSSLDFDESTKSLENLEKASSKLSFHPLGDAVDYVSGRFSALGVVAFGALEEIGRKAVNAGEQLIKSLSTDQLTAGWSKFDEMTGGVAAIVGSMSDDTKTEIEKEEEVYKAMEKLNWFTDETSYSLVDMTNNIGKFIAQGIDLDTAVDSMMGISVWASKSGQGINEAGRAMYNLSQALSQGSVKVVDWKSIEAANMATEEFKQSVIDAAVEAGTLAKASNGMYVAVDQLDVMEDLIKDDDVEAMKQLSVTATNFRDTLSSGWFSSDVLTTVLTRYASAANKIYDIYQETGETATQILSTMTETEKAEFDSMSLKAFEMSQEAKTFKEALNSVKDAVSTGWMNTYENVFGQYTEAKKLWTDLANELYAVFAEGGNERNETLTLWKNMEIGGRKDLIDSFWNIFHAVTNVWDSIKEGFREIFPRKSAEELASMVTKIKEWSETLTMSEEKTEKLKTFFSGLFSSLKGIKSILSSTYKNLIKPIIDGVVSLTMGDTEGLTLLDFLSKVGIKISEITDKVVNNNLFSKVGEFTRKVFDFIKSIKTILGDKKETGKTLGFETVKFSWIVTTFEAIKTSFSKVFSNFGSEVIAKWDKVKDFFTNIFDEIKIIFSKPKDVDLSAADAMLGIASFYGEETFFDKVKKFVNKATSLVSGSDVIKNARIIFTSIVNFAGDAITTVSEVSGKLSKSEKVKELLSAIGDLFIEILPLVTSAIKGVTNLMKTAGSWANGSESPFTTFLKKLEPLKPVWTGIWNLIKELVPLFSLILVSVTASVKQVMESIKEAGIVSVLKTIKNLAKSLYSVSDAAQLAVTKFGAVFTSIKGMFDSAAGIFDEVKKTLKNKRKTSKFKQISKGILEIGIGIALIAGAIVGIMWTLKAFSGMSFDDFITPLTLFSVIVIALGGLVKIMQSTADIKTGSLIKSILAMIVVAGILMQFVKVLLPIAAITKTGSDVLMASAAVSIIASTMAGITAILVQMSKRIDGLSAEKTVKLALTMMILAKAMKPLAEAVGSLASYDSSGLISSGAVMVVLSGILVGMTASLAGLSKLSINFKSVLYMIASSIALSLSMRVMAEAVAKLSTFSITQLLSGSAAIAILAAIMTGSMLLLSNFSGRTRKIKKIAASMVVFSAAMTSMVAVLAIISKLDETRLASSTLVVAALSAILTGMSLAIGTLMKKPGNLITAGVAMIMMATAIGILALSMSQLKDVGWKELAIIVASMLSFAVVVRILKGCEITIAALSSAFLSFGIGCIAVSASIGLLLLALSLLPKSVDNIVDSSAKLAERSDELAISLTAIIHKFLGMVRTVIPDIVRTIAEAIQEILRVVDENLPDILDTVSSIIKGVLDKIDENLPDILDKLFSIINGFLDKLTEEIPNLTTKMVTFIESLLDSIMNNSSRLIKKLIDFIIKITTDLADALYDRADEIRDALLDVITSLIGGVLKFFGFENAGKKVKEEGSEAIKKFFVDIFTRWIPDTFTNIKNKINENIDKIKTKVETKVNELKGIFNFDSLKNVGKNIGDKITGWWTDIKNGASGLISTIKVWLYSLMKSGGVIGNLLMDLIGIDDSKMKKAFSGLADKQKISNAAFGYEIGDNFIKGIVKGIQNKYGFKKVDDALKYISQHSDEVLREYTGVHSPSTMFATISEFWIEGLAYGIKDNLSIISKALSYIPDLVEEDMDSEITLSPVLDLSNIQNGIGDIESILNGASVNPGISTANSISNMVNKRTSVADDLNNDDKSYSGNNYVFENTFNIESNNPREVASEVSKILQTQYARDNKVWA